MANNRVFYASQAVAVGQYGSGDPTVVTGAQSVTMNTNFNLEQVFQLGRLAIYDNVVGDPSVEMTVTKVLDGNPLVYNLACGSGSIAQTSNQQSTIRFAVGEDTAENISDSASQTMIECSPIYLSSLSYTFPTDGNFTEEASFVGIDKSVFSGSGLASPSYLNGGVLRRQNFQIDTSTLPVGGGTSISSVTISADLGRESMYRLGRFREFHRYVTFPLEITLEIETIADTNETSSIDIPDTQCSGLSLPSQRCVIKLCDPAGSGAYEFDLGFVTLTSAAFNGGDTGGGNATITYSYIAYNTLTPKSI